VKLINKAGYQQYVKALIFILLAVLSFLIIQPFLVPIISGIFLAYIFHPFYKWVNKLIKKKWIAALLVAIVLVLIVSIPAIFLINAISKEAFTAYMVTKQTISSSKLANLQCDDDSLLCRTIVSGKRIFDDVNAQEYLDQSIKSIFSSIREGTIDFLIRLPSRILDFFIIIFVMFYIFIDGKRISDVLWNYVMIKKKYKLRLKQQINDVTYGVIYGSIITASIQGVLAGIGYALFGLTNPLLWGLLTAIAALLPFIGTSIIWVPMSIYLILSGVISSIPSLIGKGLGLFLYGVIIISSIDNIIKPKLIGERGNVHPILVLIGVFGGLKLFSIIGIILGPLILAITLTIIKLWHEETKEER